MYSNLFKSAGGKKFDCYVMDNLYFNNKLVNKPISGLF